MSQESSAERAGQRSQRKYARSIRRPVARATVRALDEQSAAGISPVWEVLPQFGAISETPGFRALTRRDALFRRTLALSDVVAGYAALGFVVGVLAGQHAHLRVGAVLLAPFIILVNKALGLYDQDQHRLRKTTLDEAPSIFHLSVIYSLFVWLLEGALVNGQFSRGQVFFLTARELWADHGRPGRDEGHHAEHELRAERCLIVGNAGDRQPHG